VAELFVNPNLPNYFVTAPEVNSTKTARSYVAEYESAKVITFPNLKPDIDLEFWSGLDADKIPALKKFAIYLGSDDRCDPEQQVRHLNKAGLDSSTAFLICNHFQATLDVLIPIYKSLFSEYKFDEKKKKVVWRLNQIMNENMHVDVYKEENENHFARMFINLDTQPRIWQTSWPIDDMVHRLKQTASATTVKHKNRGQIWSDINSATFGKSSREWWDSQPRHVAYFSPGDVWIVDSRQVSHQIFYGRRALSIDFAIPKQGMKDPSRHYLEIAGRFRAQLLNEVQN
jgi:hypothetical protein